MTDRTETVILIHGLWMSGFVLLPHQHWLRADGFTAHRFSYPSWRNGLDDNAHLLMRFIKETSATTIHLVAHSLGGLVALKMLSQETDTRIRRLVLMGTPYEGCHCGITLVESSVLAPLVGRTFEEWFNQPRPVPHPTVEIGVIAGIRPVGLGRLIPGLAQPSDGVISVSETRIAAAKDSISLDINHSGMLVSRACAEQVTNFLKMGNFIHD